MVSRISKKQLKGIKGKVKPLVMIPNMIVLPYYEVLAVSGEIANYVNNLKVSVVRKGVT